MRLITKHFGFYSGRDWSSGAPPKWYRRAINIGWRASGRGESWRPYRRNIFVSLRLLPDFIWYQEVIRQDRDWVHVQRRIAGIHGWPLIRIGFIRDDD